MRCPSVTQLPPAPLGRTGWPWTEDTACLRSTGPNGKPWPQISIITPSYNQGKFIEETIRSILLQGYPNLEYIIIDGGSNDDSVEIIKKYEPWLKYWVSERDKGQSHAINKGLRHATGEFVAYQNSDDVYWPGALETVGRLLGGGKRDVLFATADLIDAESVRRPPVCPIPEPRLGVLIRFWRGASNILPSQGFFCRLELLCPLGFFNEGLHYKLDFDLFCRILHDVPADRIIRSDEVIAGYRVTEGTKTGMMSSEWSAREGLGISRRYWAVLPGESEAALEREAKEGLSRMALFRGFYAADQRNVQAMLREVARAWHYRPSARVVHWALYLFVRLIRSSRKNRYSWA